jgi:serine/threonine-protein kinase
VVGDSSKASGTTVVVNGVSCMACHSAGMKPFQDAVRLGTGVAGQALDKVKGLYPEQKKLDALLEEDQDRFLKAVERATASSLKAGSDAHAELRDVEEPVRALVDQYQKDLGPEEAARELDIPDPKQLQDLVKANPQLRALGLGPLADGRPIKREQWETLEGTSAFQSAAQKLGKGSALRPLKAD